MVVMQYSNWRSKQFRVTKMSFFIILSYRPTLIWSFRPTLAVVLYSFNCAIPRCSLGWSFYHWFINYSLKFRNSVPNKVSLTRSFRTGQQPNLMRSKSTIVMFKIITHSSIMHHSRHLLNFTFVMCVSAQSKNILEDHQVVLAPRNYTGNHLTSPWPTLV